MMSGSKSPRAKMLILLVMLATFLSLFGDHLVHVASASSTVPVCSDKQLLVTGVEAPGSAITSGYIVRYKNVSSMSCTLSGYPEVVGIDDSISKSEIASRQFSGALGGWRDNVSEAKSKPLPVVLLRGRTGVASSVVEYTSGASAQSCPLFFRSIWVDIPGGARPYILRAIMVVCNHFDVNPIVPGSSGWAN